MPADPQQRARLRLGWRARPPQTAAARSSWRALWTSRLLVWIAAIAAGLLRSSHAGVGAVDPRGLTRGLGRVGEVLAGPVARWDAGWFLLIAKDGYQPQLGARTLAREAFYPLYPLLTRAVGLVLPLVIAGVVVSVCAFAAALYGIHRLTTLELTRLRPSENERTERIAGLAVLLTAFAPMALFFSADYSESVFLALSVALFWCARNGRWAWVGVIGALASATRAPGLVLVLPAIAIYLYGPREDRPADHPAASMLVRGGAAAARRTRALAALRPRYRIRQDVLWLALMPVGVAAYCAWIALAGGDALSPFKVEHQIWGRHLSQPLASVWYGARTTFDEYRHLLLSHVRPHITSFYFVLAGLIATVGVLRRLPLAYGVYVLAGIILPLSYPGSAGAGEPLESMPRYLLVLFPLGIWLAMWLEEHPRLRRPALVLSALLMVFYAANFATWHWAS